MEFEFGVNVIDEWQACSESTFLLPQCNRWLFLAIGCARTVMIGRAVAPLRHFGRFARTSGTISRFVYKP